MPLVEIKDFNALIDSKPFFDQSVTSKQEAYGQLIRMSRNNDYTTGNLLDFSYHKYYYKPIGIDLSIRIFLNKLILQGDQKKMMVQQCFL